MDEAEVRRETGEALHRSKLVTKLEGKGLEQVRYELAHANLTSWQRQVREEWLLAKGADATAAATAARKQSEREDRADDMAAKTLRIANSAKNAAWFAAIIALVALVVAGYAALRQFPVNHGDRPEAAVPAARTAPPQRPSSPATR